VVLFAKRGAASGSMNCFALPAAYLLVSHLWPTQLKTSSSFSLSRPSISQNYPMAATFFGEIVEPASRAFIDFGEDDFEEESIPQT